VSARKLDLAIARLPDLSLAFARCHLAIASLHLANARQSGKCQITVEYLVLMCLANARCNCQIARDILPDARWRSCNCPQVFLHWLRSLKSALTADVAGICVRSVHMQVLSTSCVCSGHWSTTPLLCSAHFTLVGWALLQQLAVLLWCWKREIGCQLWQALRFHLRLCSVCSPAVATSEMNFGLMLSGTAWLCSSLHQTNLPPRCFEEKIHISGEPGLGNLMLPLLGRVAQNPCSTTSTL